MYQISSFKRIAYYIPIFQTCNLMIICVIFEIDIDSSKKIVNLSVFHLAIKILVHRYVPRNRLTYLDSIIKKNNIILCLVGRSNAQPSA